MQKRWLWMGGAAVFLIVIGAITLYLVSPLLLSRTVQQELPSATPAAAEPTATPQEEQEQAMEATATSSEEPQEESTEMTAAVTATTEPMEEQATPTAEGPIELNSANFVDVGSSYQGSGTATIYQLADGSRLLRFEDFMVTPGPQLNVLLATNPAPTNRDELGEYVDLGPLEATSGDQEYEIPADLDLETYRSVVIYCVPFHVVFTTAYFIP